MVSGNGTLIWKQSNQDTAQYGHKACVPEIGSYPWHDGGEVNTQNQNKKQPSEAFWPTFVDPTSEKAEMTVRFPDQGPSQIEVISHESQAR